MRSLRHTIPAALLPLVAAAAAAVSAPEPTAPAVSVTPEGVEADVPAGRLTVTPLGNDIFHVGMTAGDDVLPAAVPAVAVMEPEAGDVHVSVYADSIVMTSPTTGVFIDRLTGHLRFTDSAGRTLLAETASLDNVSDTKSASFVAPAGDNLYGAGERGHSLRLNGDSLVMYNRQNYGYTDTDPRISQMGITVPYFVSDRGYGVLMDDYNEALLTLGDTIRYTSATPRPLSYYFINGTNPDLASVTSRYAALTGRQPMPPLWSLGYITSKYGYHTQAEALGAIDTLKRQGYPVDAIVLDLYWYGKETDMGRLAWNEEQWPDHRAMLSQLRKQGVNTVLITQPYINKKGAIDNYNRLSEQGMLVTDADGETHDVTTWVGDAGMLDVSNPATREWLWERLRTLTAEGVEGWWGDLGEPEVHPLTVTHANGLTAAQYHNVYGNEWSRLIYEGLRRDFPDRRPFLMMRGGTAGLQRYGVMPWSTDVSRSWGGLQPQVKIMLNSGLSGLGYMSSDLGGFAVDPANPTDAELYVRWLQMGAFTPTFRTHAQEKPEPYHYGRYGDLLRDIVRDRYRWLPYNYTLAYENASKGWPAARPLNFHGDNPGEQYAGIHDEYLWGDNVLVAPVMTKGARTRMVTFPAGEWIDWHRPSLRYRGGTTARVKAPLEEMPLFVRAGAFIPQYTQPVENTGDYDPAYLTVKYYPSDSRSSYTLYDDDRKSPTSLQDETYQLITFTGCKAGNRLDIGLSARGRYEGMPEVRVITFEVEGCGSRPREVTLSDGTALSECVPAADCTQGWRYDSRSHTLSISLPWTGVQTDIEARF